MSKIKHHRLISPLIIMLVAVFMLSSCTTEDEVVWDSIFTERFDLSEDAMHDLSDSVQNIDQISERENSTVHFKQTVGDAITMHIAFDITYAPDIDLDTISFSYHLYNEKFTLPASIEGLHGEAFEKKAGELDSNHLMTGSHFEPFAFDRKSNTVSYLLSFNGDHASFTDGDLTLLFGDFATYSDTGERISDYPDLHTLSWRPQNEALILQLDILSDDGKPNGDILASPFSFVAKVYSDQYAAAGQLHKPIEFIMRDGTVANIRDYSSPGTKSSYAWAYTPRSIDFTFIKPLDTENVKAIKIGDLTFEVD
ncbi:MAG: hypothetical protein PHW03_04050 [Eubacteriales bacterium]|nr:hypothetical protein [Eubacteriales bacterium]MDD4389955.1 hypothetical protein [Eubacteriales bacterium]